MAAFTLTELLIVVAVLTLLAATQLPALTRAKAPVKFTQCMNNCRQIGQATMLYKNDNSDAYPFGWRKPPPGSVEDGSGWPETLLRYMRGYTTNVQPNFYICPSELRPVPMGVEFQVHYQANSYLLHSEVETNQPVLGSQVRTPARYWMFIEKDPSGSYIIKSGGLGNPVLLYWNYPPGSPEYRRHNGGMCSAAADGHVEWLRTPRYLADSKTVPLNFLELGDCASGENPASSWARDNPHNGTRVKLWCRYNQKGF